MATSEVTPNANEFVSEIQIAATPERVFQALVDPGQVVKWWGQSGIYRCTEFQSDLRPGGKWKSAGEDGEGRRFEIGGEYIEIDPPRLLVQSWVATWTGDAKTIVSWNRRTKVHS